MLSTERATVQFTVVPHCCSSSKQENAGDLVMFVDGHYVGHDGFIVPRDFPEFYVRFPQYISRWLRRHADKSASKEDIEDWTQELCVHMSSLPSTSQHRKAGKQDVVQTFDPVRHYGANQARFQNYINLCLANKFRTIHSLRIKSPLCHAERLLFSEETSDGVCVDDELSELASEQLLGAAERSHKQLQDRLFVGEFIDFVRRRSPRILSALEAIAATRTQEEAARKLRMTNADFGRLCSQLRELGQSFVNGEQRLQQRGQPSVKYRALKRDVAVHDSTSQLDRKLWSRAELYNEVWNQPLVKLARKYGISDVALGKACRKLRIPHPGRGDWAKRKVGKAVKQVPLTEFKDAPIVRRLKQSRCN